MALELGTTDINKTYLGSTEIKKAYLGSTLVFDNTAPTGFAGLGLVRMFASKKTDVATIDYAVRIRTSDNVSDFYYVFWDSNDEISDSSIVSTTTTPGSETLLTRRTTEGIGKSWKITEIFCQISGLAVASGAANNYAELFDSGTLNTKDGDVDFRFLGVNGLEGVAPSSMDSGNSWSIVARGYNSSSGSLGAIYSSVNDSSTDRVNAFLDRRAAAVMGLYRNSTPTSYPTNYSATQDDSNTKNQIHVFDQVAMELTSYLDNVLQDTETVTGTYTNNSLKVGGQLVSSSPLTGGIQLLGISNTNWDATERTQAQTALTNLYT